MCLFCFSSEPLNADEMGGKYGSQYARFLDESNTFDITMCQAPTAEPSCWIGTILCFCPAQIYMRKKALNHIEPNSGWNNYICCQGVFGGCCCIQPGQMGESVCPLPCMCLEACCCPGMAVSATSIVIRDQYNLGLDEDDIRLIRCNNCLQCFSVILSCVASCTDCEADDAVAKVVDLIADIMFCCVSGCMTAQVNREINLREMNMPSAPAAVAMQR